jgi:hypothetical protein
MIGCGGIRMEDNVLVTDDASKSSAQTSPSPINECTCSLGRKEGPALHQIYGSPPILIRMSDPDGPRRASNGRALQEDRGCCGVRGVGSMHH